MEYDAQLRLQAFLDGELSEAEARDVAKWLARDREATALLGELRMTRQALVGFEVGVTLPESREFFWSKIERQISPDFPVAAANKRWDFLFSWRRYLVPAGAAAAVLLATIIGLMSGSQNSTVETAVADPAAFTYHDFSKRTTLVWFSYPAENQVADNSGSGNVQEEE